MSPSMREDQDQNNEEVPWTKTRGWSRGASAAPVRTLALWGARVALTNAVFGAVADVLRTGTDTVTTDRAARADS